MKLSKRYVVHAASPSRETVTTIDRELQSVIVQLNSAPSSGAQRDALISQLNALKHRREEAVQPKTYGRMLASLG